MKPRINKFSQVSQLFTVGICLSVAGIHSAQAQGTNIDWNESVLPETQTVSSTIGSPTLTVADGTKYAVGDFIRFNNTGGSPFGGVGNYYIVSVSGNDITVAATPGGTAVAATETQAAAGTQLSQGLQTATNWDLGVAPNTSGDIANFNSGTAGGVPAVITNAATTIYGLNFGGNGSSADLSLVSGANGTGLHALTFATNDASIPKFSTSNGNRVASLGSTSANAAPLVIAGTQGLIFNSRTSGAPTGTGTDAVSAFPPKNTRLWNIDWSGFSGGITVERGEVSLSNGAAAFLDQVLTVGNAQSITNNRIAGFSLGTSTSVVSLNGNNLGRVYGNNTLTVGNNNGTGGDFAGVIGRNFPGESNSTNLTKDGTGTQTISGVMGGTGTLRVNVGVLNLTGTVEDAAVVRTDGGTLNVTGSIASTGDVNANSGLLFLAAANPYVSQTNINGGTLKVGDATALGGSLAPSTVLDITTTDTDTAASVAPGSDLVIGSSVTATGIPADTVVSAYDSATGAVTLSQAATATGTESATFDGIQVTTTTGSDSATVAVGTPIVVSMAVTGTGIAANTRVSAYDSGTGVVTLSQNATADGIVIGTFAGTTSLNANGTLDLNGQTITEEFSNNDGTFINSDISTPAFVVNEMVNMSNPEFDGPGDITVNNILRTNGVTRRITKDGTGTLTLGGDQTNNRYGLTVNGGNVNLAKTSGEAVGRFALILNNASSTVTLVGRGDQISDATDQPHEINAGTLELNGFDEGLPALTTSTGAEPGGIVTNSDLGTTSQLTLFPVSEATWPGSITGNINLYKAGASAQTLTGAHTYTGFTNVTSGTLGLDGASLTSNVTVQGGASLGLTVGSPASTTGTVQFDASSTVTLTGSPVATTLMTAASFSGVVPVLSPAVSGWELEVSGGNLNLVAATGGFSTWITGIFAGGATVPEGQQGPNDDPDNDGIANLVEYAIAGQDPTVSNSNIGSFVGDLLSFSKNTSAVGLDYLIEESTDLGIADDWTEVSGAGYMNNANTISYQLTPGSSVKNFTRLQVTSN